MLLPNGYGNKITAALDKSWYLLLFFLLAALTGEGTRTTAHFQPARLCDAASARWFVPSSSRPQAS